MYHIIIILISFIRKQYVSTSKKMWIIVTPSNIMKWNPIELNKYNDYNHDFIKFLTLSTVFTLAP